MELPRDVDEHETRAEAGERGQFLRDEDERDGGEGEDEMAPREFSTTPTHSRPISPVVILDIEADTEGGIVNPLAPHRGPRPSETVEENGITTMDDRASSRLDPSSSRRLCGSAASSSASDSDTADDAPLLQGDYAPSGEDRVRIDMPSGDKPASPHDRFPKERAKGIICVVMLVFSAVLNEIILSFVHEKVPDTAPLPDITFSHTPYFEPGLEICEYIMLSSFAAMMLLMLFHRHRWIMLRRLMLISSLLYLMRCVTMIVTQVPKADVNFKCSPKFGENGTFWQIVVRGLSMVAGAGLNVHGKYTLCGDYIYSGHTIVLVVSALFISEYSPRRWWPLHWLSWTAALVGVAFLVVSRGHYTIDVILSYYICTRVFWNYHTMAAHPTLRHSVHNHHRKEYWFHLFRYMENGIQKPVPRRFASPIPLDSLRTLFRRRPTNSRIE